MAALSPLRLRHWQGPGLWAGALALFAAFALWGRDLAPWAFDWPRKAVLPVRRPISDAVKWLMNHADLGLFTFREATRAIAAAVEFPYRLVLALLSEGGQAAGLAVPALPWVTVVGAAALLGWRAGGAGLAALVAACFGFVALFGQWDAAMVTLASVLIAVPLGVAGGLLLGVAAWRWRWLDRALVPVLDLMQTIPVFAYLVPILILFGFGPTAAVVATVIYALPPMARVTTLALARMPAETHDLGRMIGCTRRQMTWRVMVPSARDGLMVGVNQVIMLSLNMVIIASMIGAGGLGFEVLGALRRLDFGAGLEAGLAIVVLAVAMDRLSQAFAAGRGGGRLGPGLWLLAGVTLAALMLPALRDYPDGWRLSTGPFWSDVMRWINVTFHDSLEAVKDAALLGVLVPVKRFLLGLPWLGVAGLLALAGWRLGGWRLATLAGGLAVLIAATGLWEQAMITVYLCGLSVAVAMLIGLPIGILAAERDGLWQVVRLMIDTAQTLPSFVYLMPAVMLFRVGDFTAMLAIVAFAVAPAIRYTALGLRGVDPRLIEAGRAMGCTRWQILTRIKLRMALPEILLGLNQTIMFALSMLVITALVGTRDLGQEVYVALTKADAGRGLVAGLCVAFIAIIADRLIQAGAARARARLGLLP
ncbi:glycine betaine/proline transport system permease protein [Cereibacter ovatus]|uniref:Glycine betaine/proline transport system permease protein n=1 Tax=Cereibacter ovatus TaxID=439529 RepID=A0A285CTI7_9RHOB|nr:ABC transporter permease subunit [Cereibacter ovatus]SNX70877.1 glycine betaine/proline transport system permease protein [Cereibacter ovatus]